MDQGRPGAIAGRKNHRDLRLVSRCGGLRTAARQHSVSGRCARRIEPPGQLIHGYENTFYHGQGPIFERSGIADMALSEKSPYLGGVRVRLSFRKRP